MNIHSLKSRMPRTQQQNQVLQEESRSTIIKAALELFAHHGFESSSVSMIAKRAGISQGLMYNYFKSKDELLQAIFQQGWIDVQASFQFQTLKGEEQSSLFDFIQYACRLVLQYQNFWRLVHNLRSQPAAIKHIGDGIQQFEGMILAELEKFCKASASPNPRAEARLLFALVDGISTHLVRQPDIYPLDDVLVLLKGQYESRLLGFD
jgi:AcrR family transcriptional regulator